MATKRKTAFVCTECGYDSPKWFGKCPSCGEWNTMKEINVSQNITPTPGVVFHAETAPVAISDLSAEHQDIRFATGIAELDRVLGGGMVKGSLTLISGEPGIGKSTLLLQAGKHLAVHNKVLYVTGEESAAQIKLRADRLSVTGDQLLVYAETRMDRVLTAADQTQPQVMIVDSIQTMFNEDVQSTPGSIAQIRECTMRLMQYAKNKGVSVVLVGHVNKDGNGSMFEFDNPQCLFFRGCEHQELQREELNILGKKIFKSDLKLKNQDVIMVMSDGVPHAGIGKTLNLGWQRPEIIDYMKRNIDSHMSAHCLANILASASEALYMGEPGDDTTVAAVKIREAKTVNIMIGPPANREDTIPYVEDFLSKEGIRIVCGGTTSQIVAEYLGEEVETTLEYEEKEIPPIGYIKGIDLTTEGVITLRRLIELSETYVRNDSNMPKQFLKKDGASRLADFLLEEATNINFYVGQAINEAHKGLPIDSTMKFKLVEKLAKNLEYMGKVVEIKYY